MRDLYARLVLWLIRPALERRENELLMARAQRGLIPRSSLEADLRASAATLSTYRGLTS